MENERITQTKTKPKNGERDYTDEALIVLKPLMNLWRALMSTLDTEFKPSKKPLPRALNPNLLRAATEEVLESLQHLLIATQ